MEDESLQLERKTRNKKQETRNKITVQIAFSTFQKKIIFNRTFLKYL